MPGAITGMTVPNFLVHFAADLIAITFVAFVLYFGRHSRRDLLMTYTTFNVGLFLVMTVIALQDTSIGVGFGLFAILSIIRIRSEEFSNVELGYFFVALVIALLNALVIKTPGSALFVALLNVVAVLVVYVMDHPRLLRRVEQQRITLDTIHPSDQSLRADLERRLNARVLDYAIAHVDYVREVTVLNVRFAAQP